MDPIQEFFADVLSRGLAHDRLSINPASFQYLVSLLVSNVRCDPTNVAPILAYCYRDAMGLQGARRFDAFRRLGDTALFLSGIFSSYVESTGGMSYYADMGILGYGHASDLAGDHPVMHELSDKFTALVAILNDVSITSNIDGPLNTRQVLELYERGYAGSIWRRLVERRAAPILVPARG